MSICLPSAYLKKSTWYPMEMTTVYCINTLSLAGFALLQFFEDFVYLKHHTVIVHASGVRVCLVTG